MRRRSLVTALCMGLTLLYSLPAAAGGGPGGRHAPNLSVTPSTTAAGTSASYMIDFTTSTTGRLSVGGALLRTFSSALTATSATDGVPAGGASGTPAGMARIAAAARVPHARRGC